jgi:hypothetical protein
MDDQFKPYVIGGFDEFGGDAHDAIVPSKFAHQAALVRDSIKTGGRNAAA